MIRKSINSLEAYTPGEQPATAGIIKLNTNENPYPPSPLVSEALRGISIETLRLYPDPVFSGLRRLTASLHGCSPDNIFFGNGSDEVLRLAVDVFTEHGGQIGGFVPGYSLYPVLAAIHEAKWTDRPLPAAGSLGEVPDLLRKEGGYPELFILINPNAPTSTTFSRAEIAVFASKFPGMILIDEAYADFSDAGSLADMALTFPNVMVSRTLSKSYSLAGIRVGYLVGQAELISAFYKIKDSYNINKLSQIIAAAALSDQNWMKANCARIRTTRGRVTKILREMGWNMPDSQTNFLWAEPPASAGTAEDVMAKLRRHGVVVRHFPKPDTRNRLRITIGTDAQMDRFVEVLSAVE